MWGQDPVKVQNPPWPRPGLDTLRERLIEHNCFLRLGHMAAKSRSPRRRLYEPEARAGLDPPFKKGDAKILPLQRKNPTLPPLC